MTVVLREDHWRSAIAALERQFRAVDPDCVLWWPEVTDEGYHNPDGPYGPYVFARHRAGMPSLRRVRCVESVLPALLSDKDLKSVGAPPVLKRGQAVRVVRGEYRGLSGTVRRVTKAVCNIVTEPLGRVITVRPQLVEAL
jgi:hypothetical protein